MQHYCGITRMLRIRHHDTRVSRGITAPCTVWAHQRKPQEAENTIKARFSEDTTKAGYKNRA